MEIRNVCYTSPFSKQLIQKQTSLQDIMIIWFLNYIQNLFDIGLNDIYAEI